MDPSRPDEPAGHIRVPGHDRRRHRPSGVSNASDASDATGASDAPEASEASEAKASGSGPASPVRPLQTIRRAATWAVTRPVPAALLAAGLLHLLWVLFLSHSGGDLAAQDAWAEFVGRHPDSAYNLSWYGGMHPVSYSVIAPYVMVALGVRTTMALAGTVSAGLLALILVRGGVVRRPLVPALYGAAVLTCNAISGRVTYGLGQMFALAAVAVIFTWPARFRTARRAHRLPRAAAAAVCAALATAASPVAGLFLWVVAGALLLSKRRPAAFALAVPPAVVVGVSAWLFPFSGTQPMGIVSGVLPVLVSVAVYALSPREWRTVRIGALVYAAGVLLTWAIPSQVGTNVTRLGLFFGGVVLLAALTRARRWSGRWVVTALAMVAATIWSGYKAGEDIVYMRPAAAWAQDVTRLVHELGRQRDIGQGRVEVVPVRSHRESSALSPYVNLARGWNRQADVERNPLFYDGSITPDTYRAWLNRWAVRYVVLPSAEEPDPAARAEAAVVASRQPYLTEIWSDENWRLYRVEDPAPLAEPPATVDRTDAGEITVTVRKPGPVLIRVPYSPWLGLMDAKGHSVEPPHPGPHGEPAINRHGCLTKAAPVGGGGTGGARPGSGGGGPASARDGASVRDGGRARPAESPGSRPSEYPGAGGRDAVDEWTVLHAPRPGTYRLASPYRFPRGTACPEPVR
ncbi:MFS transporter [Streptomyces sp. NPDC003077]|uniref:MFS transporter n=1 Tax=Streptomyces sp. NPDC003077 TaxID=3154443 RepID=UPI0033B88349